MNKTLEETIEILKELKNNEPLYFGSPIDIQHLSLYTYRVYAVCVSPDNKLHYIGTSLDWSEFMYDESRISRKILQGIHDRLQLIRSNFIKIK